MLIVHPLNLVGHVRIASQSDALAMLRLFSSPETYHYFPLLGEVEVRPGSANDAFVLEREAFDRMCRMRIEEYEMGSGKKAFSVTRPLIKIGDGSLSEITELLHEDGSYQVVARRLLSNDPSLSRLIPLGPM